MIDIKSLELNLKPGKRATSPPWVPEGNGWALSKAVEKEMATHSSILAQRIPWTEEPGGLQFMGSQSIGHDLATKPPPK